MQRFHVAAIFSISAVLCLSFAFLAMGYLPVSAASLADYGGYISHLGAFHEVVVASPALLALRTQLGDLETRASAKIAAFTPDISPETARGLNAEFDALADQIDATKAQIRTLEQSHQSTGRIYVAGQGEDEKRGAAMENALLHRFNPRGVQLSEQGRQYRGMSLIEMGTECLEARGIGTRGMSKHQRADAMLNMRSSASEHAMRAGGSMSTSDFPNILANVANKTLRQGYEAAPQTFKPLVRVVTVSDFKTVSRVQIGEAPRLELVKEGGEFSRGKMGEATESYSISTYGKIVSITRQVIVNDDLDAFTRVPRSFGVAAANLESDLVWQQILDNPRMGDGKALFHADHKNIGAGGGINTDNVAAGRLAMRMQAGLDGRTLLNIAPVYLIVPVAMEADAEKFLGQIYPTRTADGVPGSMRKLVPISEPRLDEASKTTWYMAADPALMDLVELAYLDGMEGLYTETRIGFDTDGVEVKVRQDLGAKVIDHRGLYRSA